MGTPHLGHMRPEGSAEYATEADMTTRNERTPTRAMSTSKGNHGIVGEREPYIQAKRVSGDPSRFFSARRP